MSKKMKKLLILNIPYLVLGLLFTKLPEAWRHTNGVDLGQKILNLGEGLSRAFTVPFPSFYPADLLIGLAIGALLRLIIYVRSKNAKKYRKGVEYPPLTLPKMRNSSPPMMITPLWKQLCKHRLTALKGIIPIMTSTAMI